MDFTFLKAKESRDFLEKIKNQWGAEVLDLMNTHFFYLSEKEKVYMITRRVADIDYRRLRINSMGLYFAEFKKDQLRLSIEGSQIVGKKASKNILELNNEQVASWLKGKDVSVSLQNSEGFMLVKHNNDFIGSGKVKEEKLLNFVPKTRRVNIE